jgi:hypothetical protein
MRALVVYESMYGNTHLIAEAIAPWPSSRVRRVAGFGRRQLERLEAGLQADDPDRRAVTQRPRSVMTRGRAR